MLDRRISLVKNLEEFLVGQVSEISSPLAFGEPPELHGESVFDLALPCFAFAKTKKMPPPKIAEEISQLLEAHREELEIENVQPIKAYVNIAFKRAALGRELLERVKDPMGKTAKAFSSEKYVVDFSSPNIAKPFGIGHLRSTNIGASICRILEALGAEVVRINHLGDWGTQFGKLITAYKRFGSADFVKGDAINNLYKLYVEFHKQEEEDPALLDEARDWFVKLEQGDDEATELWTWFKDVSYQEFKKLYEKLGVNFDFVTGESFYNDLMPATVESLKQKGLIQESEGALIVDLDAYKMAPCLIQKSDGSTLYATRDLATAEYRVKTFQPTHLVYVVGGEQKLHFRQIFKVLELMGYDWAKNCVHVDFGLIRFPEGKMSTRRGNIVLLDDVLHEAEEKALEIIKEKDEARDLDDRMNEDEQKQVARQVGTGAVIFFDLKAKRTKDVQFKWEDILSFEGDSGPYLQYTAVRLEALLRKAKQEGIEISEDEVPGLTTLQERALAQALLSFSHTIETAGREFEPSLISHGLLDLAAAFNRFYMNVRVIKGEEKEQAGRLMLVKASLTMLTFGLSLLGIQCPERM